MTGTTRFHPHDEVAVVEHDAATRQPAEGGQVLYGTVTEAALHSVHARFGTEEPGVTMLALFRLDPGGEAWTGGYRVLWRLVPLCRCGKPVLGEPVTDPDDPTGEEFCSEGCLTSAAEASHGAMASRERD